MNCSNVDLSILLRNYNETLVAFRSSPAQNWQPYTPSTQIFYLQLPKSNRNLSPMFWPVKKVPKITNILTHKKNLKYTKLKHWRFQHRKIADKRIFPNIRQLSRFYRYSLYKSPLFFFQYLYECMHVYLCMLDCVYV